MSNQQSPPGRGGGSDPYSQHPPQPGQVPPRAAQPQPYEHLGHDGGSGRSGKRLPFMLGAAGVLVVVLIVAAVFLLRGGGTAGSSPEETLDEFVAAVNDTDCDAIKDLTTKSVQEQLHIDSCADGELTDGADGDVEYSAGNVSEDGDTATGTVELTGGPAGAEGVVFVVNLTEEDDGWLVDSFEIDRSSLAPEDS